MVCVADLHLHPFKQCSRDGGRDRLQDGLSALQQSLEYAQELGALWVFLGDAKMSRTIWNQEALNGALDCFRRFSGVPKLLLPGNHDGPRLPGGSGLQAFADLERTRVVESPTLLPGWGPGLAVWPCEADEDGLAHFVEAAPKEGCKILLSHGLLSGCQLSPDIKGTGLTPERFGIGKASPVFPLAIFGDVHRGQIFREDKRQWAWHTWDNLFSRDGQVPLHVATGFRGQIVYPGDPYQQNWGEAGEVPKGVLIVRPGPNIEMIYLQPLKGPRYIVEDWTAKTEDEFGQYLLGGVPEWHGNFVKLVLPEWGSSKAVQTSLEVLRKTEAIRSFQPMVIREARVKARTNISAAMKPRELLEGYMSSKPPEDGLDPKAVLLAGERLMGDQE